jgi:hypothetical protein
MEEPRLLDYATPRPRKKRRPPMIEQWVLVGCLIIPCSLLLVMLLGLVLVGWLGNR